MVSSLKNDVADRLVDSEELVSLVLLYLIDDVHVRLLDPNCGSRTEPSKSCCGEKVAIPARPATS